VNETEFAFSLPEGLQDAYVKQVAWETSLIHELDLTSTELSGDCLMDILCRMPGFTYLALGYCEFFDDTVNMLLLGYISTRAY